MKKIIALLLAAVLALGLCGCGAHETAAVSETVSGTNPPEPLSDSAAEGTVTLPGGETIDSVKVWNGTLYITAEGTVYTAPLSGGTAQALYEAERSIEALSPAGDGVWVYERTYDPESGYEAGGTLRHIGADGTELAAVELLDVYDAENGYISLTGTGDGGALVSGGEALYVLDGSGALANTIEVSGGNFSNLAALENGDIVGVFYETDALGSSTRQYFARLDTESGMIEELGEIEAHSWTEVLGGGSEVLWINTSGGAAAYDLTSQTETDSFEWINVGVNSTNLAAAVFSADGSVTAVEYTDDKTGLSVHAVERERSGEAQVLTLAVFGGLIEETEAIIAFNNSHSDYQIEIKDYMAYNDIYTAIEQFNYDVIAGDVPDIIDLTEFSYDTLAAQGLLLDLYPYLDADPELSRGDFVESVLAASEKDGALYSVIPYYAVITAAALEGVFQSERVTLSDLQEALAQEPDASAFGVRPRSEMLELLVTADAASYIDIDGGWCDFDSEEFIQLLEFVDGQPEPSEEEVMMGYELGQRVLDTCGIMSLYPEEVEDLGGDVDYVGLPGVAGTPPWIEPMMELGVSSTTAAPEACWEFIRYYLTEEFQTAVVDEWRGLPLMTSCLEESRDYILSFAGDDPAITEENVDAIMAVITSAEGVERRFSRLSEALDIVLEEAEQYFAGQKTAEAAASSIQSRVGLYIAEQG